jgi:hypothetical protein
VTTYRKPMPYRKPQTYRGAEMVPGAGPPTALGETSLPWRVPGERAHDIELPWHEAARASIRAALPWEPATKLAAHTFLPWAIASALDASHRASWNAVGARDSTTEAPWRTAARFDGATALRWAETAVRSSRTYAVRWGVAIAEQLSRMLPWGAQAARATSYSLLWDALAARGAFVRIPWGPAGRYDRPYGTPWNIEPPPVDGDPITVPILPVYFMVPTLSVVRLPDRAPIGAISCSISTDRDSWCWSFNMQIARADLSLVNPADAEDPVEIEIAINGYVWTALVESFQDQRVFGARTVRLSGRSRSAELATPIAPVRSYLEPDARDASQLAGQELDGTGWTLVWDAVDWLVPGGVFSYSDLAPIDAIARVAAAIGAAVESDPEDKTVRVVPAYEVSPWEWDAATPYAIIPANILTAGDGAWRGGPNANGIYVYSQNQAFGALVKITGTGGEEQLPMVVESLIVEADGARERGRIELARAGRIKNETRSIPLFPQPHDLGLVPVGKLLEVHDAADEEWRGQVTGVTVSAEKSGRACKVRQVLAIERQYR